jgi:hypothetical protein
MSDDMQDQVERAEDRAEEDVEAHMQDAPRDGAPHAGPRRREADRLVRLETAFHLKPGRPPASVVLLSL